MDIKAYVINLEARKDRRDGFDLRTKEIGSPFPYEYVRAVTADEVTDEYLNACGYSVYRQWKIPNHPLRWWNRDIRLGEVACSLSHLKVWEYARSSPGQYTLIFEDDASFDPHLNNRKRCGHFRPETPWAVLSGCVCHAGE